MVSADAEWAMIDCPLMSCRPTSRHFDHIPLQYMHSPAIFTHPV